MNYSLREVGDPEQAPEKIKPFIGYPLPKMYPHFSQAPIDELCRLFQTKAKETIIQSTTALPGADEVLRRLKDQGYTITIASTKIIEHITGIVTKLDWNDLFTALVGGNEVANVKPAPDAFLRALELVGRAPSDAIVVGDTENDILAARAIPVKSVAIKSPYGEDKEIKAAGPDHFLNDISELPDLLDQLA